MLSIALFEPDIPQNTGSIMRLAACVGVPLHIIEPCGFVLDSKELKRVAMDYGGHVSLPRHISWSHFLESLADNGINRLVLLSTKAENIYTDFTFKSDDCLLLGRESSGVPEAVTKRADARVKIPMSEGARSLNVALTASMVIGEALRQTSWQNLPGK